MRIGSLWGRGCAVAPTTAMPTRQRASRRVITGPFQRRAGRPRRAPGSQRERNSDGRDSIAGSPSLGSLRPGRPVSRERPAPSRSIVDYAAMSEISTQRPTRLAWVKSLPFILLGQRHRKRGGQWFNSSGQSRRICRPRVDPPCAHQSHFDHETAVTGIRPAGL